MNQNQLIRFIRLLISACLLAMVSACNQSTSTNPETTAVTRIPASIQKLTLPPSGTLRAWITIDGGTRIEMTLDPDAGTATVTIDDLTLEPHDVLIEYEYTDAIGVITVATASTTADMSAGSLTISFADSDYTTDYDEDNDGLTNAQELSLGKNPRIQPAFPLSCFPLAVAYEFGDIAFDYDGNLLIPGITDGSIYVLNPTTCAQTTLATIAGQTVYSVVEDKINERVYAGTLLGSVYEINPSDGSSTLLASTGNNNLIGSIVIAPPDFGAYGRQLIVADSITKQILAIDQSQTSPTPEIIATVPGFVFDLVFDNNGTLFTTDYDNGKILTVAADGLGTLTEFATGLSKPTGLEVDNTGSRLFIADVGNNALYAANLSSGFLTKHRNVNFGTGAASGLAYDTNGSLLMRTGNKQIEALKASALQSLNTSCMPLAVASAYGNHAFNSAGDLLIANNEDENILLLDRTSCTTTPIATITGRNLISVVEDTNTNLIYTGTSSGHIYEINPGNGSATLLTSATGNINAITIAPSGYGSYGGQLIIGTLNGAISAIDQSATNPSPSTIANIGNAISDLAFSKAGTLYVVDFDFGNIITVAADGTSTDFITAVINEPDGIEIDDASSRLFIADSGTDTLYSSTFSGVLTTLRSIDFSTGFGPSGLTYDGNGTLLMHLATSEIVAQPVELAAFNTSCLPLTTVASSYGDVALNARGDLLIANTLDNNILLLDRASCTTSTIATISGQNLISVAEDAARNRLYAVAAVTGYVYEIDPDTGDATLLVDIGISVNAIVVAPAGYGSYAGQLIIAGSDGIIYAVDQTATTPVPVSIVDIGTAALDLIFSSDDTLYVADYDNGKVVTVAANGTLADFAAGFVNPDGLAIDNTGARLFIADSGVAADKLYSAAIPSGTVTELGIVNFGDGPYPTGLAFDGYSTILMHTGDSQIAAFGL